MKKILLGTVLALAVAMPAFAQDTSELSSPIVLFTPVIMKNADALELTEAQRGDLKEWLATMPAAREAVEAEAVAVRAALREAIIAGAPVPEREALADTVGALETKLVMMRSGCVDYWREKLTADQFAKLVEMAAAK